MRYPQESAPASTGSEAAAVSARAQQATGERPEGAHERVWLFPFGYAAENALGVVAYER